MYISLTIVKQRCVGFTLACIPLARIRIIRRNLDARFDFIVE